MVVELAVLRQGFAKHYGGGGCVGEGEGEGEGEERLMEIQQHDGVVVEVAGIPAGLRQAQAGGEVSREGEGGARA